MVIALEFAGRNGGHTNDREAPATLTAAAVGAAAAAATERRA